MPQSLGILRDHSFTSVLYNQTAIVTSKYGVGLCQMKSPNINQRAKRKITRNSRNSSHGTPLSFLKIHQGYVLHLQEENKFHQGYALHLQEENMHTAPRKLLLRERLMRKKKKSFLQFFQDSEKWYSKNESKSMIPILPSGYQYLEGKE